MVYVILTIIIVGLLIYILYGKIDASSQESEKYSNKIAQLVNERDQLNIDISNKYGQLKTLDQQIENKEQEYQKRVKAQDDMLADMFSNRLAEQQETLQNLYEQQEKEFQQKFDAERQSYIEEQTAITWERIAELQREQNNIEQATIEQRQRYEGLLAPLKQYEQDREAKYFYTIKIPEEYRGDINILLRDVQPRIKHPDVVNKLIWNEYVKPYLDDTFKRTGVKAEPGIYKLTNINNGKSYVGKSTDVKKRIAEHFKSAVGISTIASQAVHDAIFQEGVWNWTIEVLTYCERDKLNELEKYYIEFFNCQAYGYNKTAGG